MITVFGSINLDLIFALERLPGPGETLLGPTTQIEPGGKGANQAVAAALDGSDVAIVGAVGDDALAAAALAGLIEAGVDVSGVARRPGSTGCAAICTDRAGRNQITVGSGANLRARADQMDDTRLGAGHTIVLQMEVAAAETEAVIRRARGARLVLNLAPALPLPLDALRRIDVLVVNETEAAWLAGHLGVPAAAAALHAALGAAVVRTLGEAGAEYAAMGEDGTVAAHRIDVVDSTAAGDCFTGVLASALDRGMPWRAALDRASAAAALCCTRAGSQRSLPRGSETDGLLQPISA